MGVSVATQQTARQQRANPQRTASQSGSRVANGAVLPIHRLQRAVGNRGISRLLQSRTIQPKLTVSHPEDESEREADRVAETVKRSDNQSVQRASGRRSRPNPLLHEDDDEEARRFASVNRPAQRIQRSRFTSIATSPVQLQTDEADDESSEQAVQMKVASSVLQRQEEKEDEAEALQAKFEVQRQNSEEEEEESIQRKTADGRPPDQSRGSMRETKNRGDGLPFSVRAGLETLSGRDLSNIRVHWNASGPAQLNALAYTQGQDIHVGPGQEKHLAHEGWHAVQQMQGRVRPQMKVRGMPLNADDGLEREADVMGAKALQISRSPMSLPSTGWLHGRAAPAAGGPIQRTTSKGVSVSAMKFAPKDIPADGATISQATVQYSARIAAGAKINWSIVGPAFGSVIDGAGKIKAGPAIPAGKEKQQLKVKAEDNVVAAAHTFGLLNLWDAEFFQAKQDFPKFIGLGTLTKDPFTPGNFGKLAVSYTPKKRRLDATVRVKFLFVDDLPGAAKWNKKNQASFESKFINSIQKRWSQQYRFVNVREPKKIWKKLNPVKVPVMVKRDSAAPHQTITIHKKVVTSETGVGGVLGVVKLRPGAFSKETGLFPAVGPSELAALNVITPTPILFAAGKSDISALDTPKLEFMATYLRRIKVPPFRITITGHHQQVVHPAGATAAQKKAAIKQAKQLSKERADKVFQVLKAGRATVAHKTTRSGVGDAGAAPAAAWDKADIVSALPPGFKSHRRSIEHEFGHMIGIGDEYANDPKKIGTEAKHYDLTKKAFGQPYADVQAKKVSESESLMAVGSDLRPHHYVTLWDALATMTSTAAFPKKPFVHADWQFEGQ